MKRSVLATILGTATSTMVAISASSQGFVWFANYTSVPFGQVTYTSDPNNAPPGKAGLTVGPGFSASLYYGFGTISDPKMLNSLESVQQGYPTKFLANADGDPAGPAGYFMGPVVGIPGYTSGPVTFQVVAWANSGPYGGASYEVSSLRGGSALFTMLTIATGAAPASQFDASLLFPFTVQIIPEPSIFALIGLGGLALLLFRRRT